MSWYPKELVTCGKCGERFSTPIDRHQHSLHCKVIRNPDGVVAKIGTHGSEVIKVTRGVVRERNTIWFTRADGSKCRGKVSWINEAATFVEMW